MSSTEIIDRTANHVRTVQIDFNQDIVADYDAHRPEPRLARRK